MDVSTASRHESVPETGSRAALCDETGGPVRASSPTEVGATPRQSSDDAAARPVLARIPDVDADDLWDEQASDRPRDGRLLSQRLSLKLLAAGALLLVAVAVAPFLWPGNSRDQGQGDGLPDWHPGPPAPSAEMAPAWKPNANGPAQADQQTPDAHPSAGFPLPAPPPAGEQFLPGTAPEASGFAGQQQPEPGSYGAAEPPEESSSPRLHVLAPPEAAYGTPGGNVGGSTLPSGALQDDPHANDSRAYDPRSYDPREYEARRDDPSRYDARAYHPGTYNTPPADPRAQETPSPDTRHYDNTQPPGNRSYNTQPYDARSGQQPATGTPYSNGGQTGLPSAREYPGTQTPLSGSTHACCPQHPAGSGSSAYPGQPNASTGYPYGTTPPAGMETPREAQRGYGPSSYDPRFYSPSTYSPSTYSPSSYDPRSYGPSDSNPGSYNSGTYDPSSYSPNTYDPSSYNPQSYNPQSYNAQSYNAGVRGGASVEPTPSTYGSGVADRRASVSPYRAGAPAQAAGDPANYRARYSAGYEAGYRAGFEPGYPSSYPSTGQGVNAPGTSAASLEGTIERPDMGTRY